MQQSSAARVAGKAYREFVHQGTKYLLSQPLRRGSYAEEMALVLSLRQDPGEFALRMIQRLPASYHAGVWEGSAEMLEDFLCGHKEGWSSSVMRSATRLMSKGSLPAMLARLREDQPDRVDKRDRIKVRGWAICAPVGVEPTAVEGVDTPHSPGSIDTAD